MSLFSPCFPSPISKSLTTYIKYSPHAQIRQSWISIGRTEAKAEAPIVWPPDAQNWLIGKHPDAGKDWRWEGKAMTEDEICGWHYWFDGHESEQALGVGDGQGGLVCCSPWGHKQSDTTEWLNWAELKNMFLLSEFRVTFFGVPNGLFYQIFYQILILP